MSLSPPIDEAQDYEKIMKYMESLYEKPEPSLCDTCRYAYYIEGGSVGIGYKSYKQRYCDKRTVAIHCSGYTECEFYEKKEGDIT